MSAEERKCAACGNPATCVGSYDSDVKEYGCDECCGHGNEDGYCRQLGDELHERRVAIAQACGWTITGYRMRSPDGCWFDELPDYTGSRDAAISAVVELITTVDQMKEFKETLRDLVRGDNNLSEVIDHLAFTATPEQICTALVKALNLDQKGAQG